ncbi:haloacid dehalogenase [Kocuria dechangensis]|uniref:Haloacid dehalogenase n=2 Tax=Kocuria dechangensis TaxID=1176249 RepID=A0A917GS71_9MICC|nr:haloacid dehalogenase [Kocuria dechangensis]
MLDGMTRTGSPRGVLFDVDGTLIDSSYLHTVAWWHAFNQKGWDVPMARIHRLIGMGSEQLIDELLPADRDRDQDESIGDAHGSLFSVHWAGLKPTRGAAELVRRCADAGLVVVLASSSNATEVAAMRQALGTDDVLTAVTTATDAERSKPAPDIFAAALEAGGLRAEDAIVVGDARWDVVSARELGLDTVGLTSGGISEGELREAGAVAVYADPQALLDDFDHSPLARLLAGD